MNRQPRVPAELLARRPDLASTPNLGVALHAIALESA